LKNQSLYISLPKNVSFAVFEATKLHGDLFIEAGQEVVYLSRNKDITHKNLIYFKNITNLISFLIKKGDGMFYGITVFEILIGYLASLFNNKIKLYFWVQGLVDEEDFLTKKSKFRYYIFHFLIKIALKLSKKIVVVTEHMFTVLVQNYGCDSNKEYLVINCKSRVHYNGSTKIEKSLSYIGGLSKWQNVDKALKFYNALCKENDKYRLFIATFNHAEAKALIESNVNESFRANIELTSIKKSSEVEDFLSKMQYGFLIRDDILLNNVASPIKLAEYLACGVNPIMSSSLVGFKEIIAKHRAGIILEDGMPLAIKQILENEPSTENALSAYNVTYENTVSIEMIERFLL
jgi:glycosyltransferase involved in cell wall biosynthesis